MATLFFGIKRSRFYEFVIMMLSIKTMMFKKNTECIIIQSGRIIQESIDDKFFHSMFSILSLLLRFRIVKILANMRMFLKFNSQIGWATNQNILILIAITYLDLDLSFIHSLPLLACTQIGKLAKSRGACAPITPEGSPKGIDWQYQFDREFCDGFIAIKRNESDYIFAWNVSYKVDK